MKEGKSQDSLGLVTEMILRASHRTRELLAHHFTCILLGNGRPDNWDINFIALLFKSGSPTDMANYRPLTLLPTLYKIYSTILFRRVRSQLEGSLTKDSAGFRRNFNTEDHLLTISLLIQFAKEWNFELWICKIDIRKAFDTLDWGTLITALQNCTIDEHTLRAIMESYKLPQGRVKVNGHTSEPFDKSRGTRQGDPISALLFCIAMEFIFKPLVRKWKAQGIGVAITESDLLNNLRFADDTLLIATTQQHLEIMTNDLQTALNDAQLFVHPGKTSIITNAISPPESVNIFGKDVTVRTGNDTIPYLGSVLCFENLTAAQIDHRIKCATFKFRELKHTLCFRSAPLKHRLRLFDSVVTNSFTHGASSWAWTQHNEARIIQGQCKLLREFIRVPIPKNLTTTCYAKQHFINKHIKGVLHRYNACLWEEEALRRIWRFIGHTARRAPSEYWNRLLLNFGPSAQNRHNQTFTLPGGTEVRRTRQARFHNTLTPIRNWYIAKEAIIPHHSRYHRIEYACINELWMDFANEIHATDEKGRKKYTWQLNETNFVLFSTYFRRKDSCIPIPPPFDLRDTT